MNGLYAHVGWMLYWRTHPELHAVWLRANTERFMRQWRVTP